MVVIRRGVFETNSSSTHSLTISTKSDYEKWKRGELLFDNWKNGFVEITEETEGDGDCYSYTRYEEKIGDYYETFNEHYTTQSGDEIVVFGYHGTGC